MISRIKKVNVKLFFYFFPILDMISEISARKTSNKKVWPNLIYIHLSNLNNPVRMCGFDNTINNRSIWEYLVNPSFPVGLYIIFKYFSWIGLS